MLRRDYAKGFISQFDEMRGHFSVIDNYNLLKNPWENAPSEVDSNNRVRTVVLTMFKNASRSPHPIVNRFIRKVIESMGPVAKIELKKLVRVSRDLGV